MVHIFTCFTELSLSPFFFHLEFLNAFLFLLKRRDISLYFISNSTKIVLPRFLNIQFALSYKMSSFSHSSQNPLKCWSIFNWLSFRAVVLQWSKPNFISILGHFYCFLYPPLSWSTFSVMWKTSLSILPSSTKIANTLSHCIVRYVYILPSN